MTSPTVVEALDEVGDRPPGRVWVREAASAQQLACQRGKEALTHGVVVGVARGAHGESDTCGLASLAECVGGVLRPPIGVVHDVHRAPTPDGHGERTLDQLGSDVGLRSPAHDQAAPGVENHGDIEAPGLGGHLGDVGDPQFVAASGSEVPIHQVWRRARGWAAA